MEEVLDTFPGLATFFEEVLWAAIAVPDHVAAKGWHVMQTDGQTVKELEAAVWQLEM